MLKTAPKCMQQVWHSLDMSPFRECVCVIFLSASPTWALSLLPSSILEYLFQEVELESIYINLSSSFKETELITRKRNGSCES